MAQTSNTEAMAISPLKHPNGVPLGTTTTLVDPRAGQHALLQAAPQGLHLGHHARTATMVSPGLLLALRISRALG